MIPEQLLEKKSHSAGHWLGDLTVGTKDIAEHSSEILVLRQAVHHLGQAA